MQTCRECGATCPDGAVACDDCGAYLTAAAAEPTVPTNADYDQEAEREQFQAKYGVDIGDRSVDEFLQYLGCQDYSPTIAFWSIVVAEIVAVGLAAYGLIGSGGWELLSVFLAVSALLSISVYADTAQVKLFERWAKIRWLYIVLPLVPLAGQIAAFLYLVLRRLKRERMERLRRRLLESGLDVQAYSGPN